MTKKNSRVVLSKALVVRVIIYGLVLMLFIAAYHFNEYLNEAHHAMINNYLVSGRIDLTLSEYNYLLLQESSLFVVAMVVALFMMMVLDWSITKYRHLNKMYLVVPGIILYTIVLTCMLDETVGSWGIPSRCGSGNCFLLDGLDTIAYLVIIPVAFIVGTVLLALNRHKKTVATKRRKL